MLVLMAKLTWACLFTRLHRIEVDPPLGWFHLRHLMPQHVYPQNFPHICSLNQKRVVLEPERQRWHAPTQAPYMSALCLHAHTVNLQLLNGRYKLMVAFQMSKAHTNDYANK